MPPTDPARESGSESGSDLRSDTRLDAMHRRLFDASPNPYLVLDRRLRIVTANPAYLAVTGRSLDDLVGRCPWEAFPASPDTERQVRESFERVIATGREDTVALLRFDIARPGGTGEVEERWWTITHTPIAGADGAVEMILQHPIEVSAVERLGAVPAGDALAELAAGPSGLIDRARRVYETNRDLKADVERLQSLFRKAPGFMAVLRGPRHLFEFVNDAFVGLLGERDYLGRTVRAVLPDLEGQRVFETLDWVFEQAREFVGYDLAVHVRDGGRNERRRINLIYSPIVEQGTVAGIFVEGTDVTEQHRARAIVEEQLVQLRRAEHLQAFQLALSDCLRPLTSAEEVIGAASRLLGERLDLARVVFAEVAVPSMRVTVRRDWCRAGLAGVAGRDTTLDDFGPDMADALRAGHDVLVADVRDDPRTLSHQAAYEAIGVRAYLTIPLLKGGGLRVALSLHATAPRAWSADELRIARETAERTWAAVEVARAQAELRAERDESQYIFDTMTEGFGLIDRDWRVVRMNNAGLQLVQRSRAEVVGHNHWDVFPAAIGTEIERMCRQVYAERRAGSVDYGYPLPEGGTRWMEVRAFPAMDGGLAVFFRDVTARHEAEDRLRLEAHRKDEFLAMLAHELRNPLAPISAAADLLALGSPDPARIARTSAIITRQVGHMTSLVDDLLDVSRVTRGLVALECVPVDVKAMVADAVEQVRPLVEGRRHRLELHLAPEHAVVMGDRKRLVQVLANLLGNAAKYTPEGGRIALHMEVEPEPDDGRVVLCVIDDGIGMTPEVRQGAFELFTQAERTPDRSQGGLGIGLALVKSLVELHGGSVTAHSEGPGRGSRFTVFLPHAAAPMPGPGAPRDAGGMALARAGSGRSVLVVDDNVDAAQLLAMLLETAGHRAAVEHAPGAALARARAEPPEACILDIGLPDMDGNELARRLRALPGMAGVLLIALTGYGRPQDREAALAAGFDHHLVKPVDVQQLLGLLG
ncbi:hybrid sensor histidine kinase/response regulator [Massilia sp. TN1-12]|uniref:hybrid sensor histidine kinase/response regulator n=1 Tax=Massilia paldalensis TaxID=3377675 RepID=UPI0038507587